MQSSNNKAELSIIIISYNTRQITENCINSIYKSFSLSLRNKQQVPKFEIIIIDNASTDGSKEMLERYKKKHNNLKIIESNINQGFAKANNYASKITKAKYLLFLNSDIIVVDDAIVRLFRFFQQNENTFNFLGGKLLNKDNTSQPSCGKFYTLPIVFASLFLKGDYWNLTRYSPKKIKQVDWVSGACILTKKELFDRVGRFDENIFMYMDELDLLYRAKNKGYKVFFYPDSKFIHLGSASSKGKTYPILQVYKGFIYFYEKHYSSFELFLLKVMLKLKALIAILIGKIINNKYLVKTYEQAYNLAKKT